MQSERQRATANSRPVVNVRPSESQEGCRSRYRDEDRPTDRPAGRVGERATALASVSAAAVAAKATH